MPPLAFFEYQYRPYSELPPLSAPLLDGLDRLNTAARAAILTPERKGLRSGGQVGVLRVGDVQVEILPRLAADARHSAANLFPLISLAFDLPLHPHEAAGLAQGQGTWVEALARLFAAHLHRETRAGLLRGYRGAGDTLPVLRGRWDVQRQITRRGGLRGDFEVRYDAFTADLPLNRLFRFVIERLHEQGFSAPTRALLDGLRETFDPVPLPTAFSPAQASAVRLNRLTNRYAPALALARLFLAGHPVILRAGNVPVSAFTFSMASLFERSIAALVSRRPADILPPDRCPSHVTRQGEGLRLHLARAGKTPLHPLRPDILLRQHGQPAPWLIIDTKYKTLPADPADLYQMLAYATRLNCPTALLLYPQTAQPVRRALQIEDTSLSIHLATVNLAAPIDGIATELREILQNVIR